jgi:outer membrane protein
MKKPLKMALSALVLASSSHLYADNLLDVYRLAKDGDPTFLASDAGRTAASERVNQSLATLLPQLNGTLGYSISDDESERTTTGVFTALDGTQQPILAESSSVDDTTVKNYSITLEQEIYSRASWLNLRQSEKRSLQSNVNHEGSKQDLIIRVSEAYFNILAAKDSVEFSKAETQAVSQELAQTKQRFEVGLIAITDVHEAQSRYDRAVANQIIAQNNLDNTHELLQLITGRYHYGLLGLKIEIPLRNPQPEVIEQWVKEAVINNIDIKASKIGLDIAKQSISISQAGHLPTVGLTASISDNDVDFNSPKNPRFNDNGDLIGFSNTTTNSGSPNTSISLNVRVPLYSGGRTNSQVKEAQSLYQQAAHNLESSRRLAVSTTRSSYLGVVANVGSVKAFKQAVVSSEKSLEATQAGFEVGTRTIVDVLLQTQLLFDAKRQYSRSRYDYVLNTLRLKQATGLLSENDLAKVNQLLR